MRARGLALVALAVVVALAGCGSTAPTAPDPTTTSAATSAAGTGADAGTGAETEVRLHLVRHGETVQNVKGILAGWADAPLTPEGERVAASAGTGLADVPFVAAWSSDLGRTQQTARAVLDAHPDAPDLQLDAGLREWWFGGFEGDGTAEVFAPLLEPVGASVEDLQSDLGGVLTLLDDDGDARIGDLADLVAAADPWGLAESGADVEARVAEVLDRVVADAVARGGGDVLVVTHGMTILSMLDVMGVGDVDLAGSSNVARTRVTWADGTWTLESHGDVSHLAS